MTHQLVCSNYSNNGCVACPTNSKNAVNGLCIPEGIPMKSINPDFFQSINIIQQSIVSGDIPSMILGNFADQITNFSFNFQYRRISYPENDIIGILSIGVQNINTFNSTSLLEFYERGNKIIMVNKFNPNDRVIIVLENDYTDSNRFEWLNLMVNCNLTSSSCTFSSYNYKTHGLVTKKVSSTNRAATKPDDLYTATSGTRFVINYNYQSTVLNLPEIQIYNGIVATNTEFELSNIYLIPNYDYPQTEFKRFRSPIPKTCDKNCVCGCVNNSCPENCKLKNNIIGILNNNVVNNQNTNSGQSSFGYNSENSDSKNKLFKELKSFIFDKSYNLELGQKFASLTLNRFIINAELNLKNYFISIQSSSSSSSSGSNKNNGQSYNPNNSYMMRQSSTTTNPQDVGGPSQSSSSNPNSSASSSSTSSSSSSSSTTNPNSGYNPNSSSSSSNSNPNSGYNPNSSASSSSSNPKSSASSSSTSNSSSNSNPNSGYNPNSSSSSSNSNPNSGYNPNSSASSSSSNPKSSASSSSTSNSSSNSNPNSGYNPNSSSSSYNPNSNPNSSYNPNSNQNSGSSASSSSSSSSATSSSQTNNVPPSSNSSASSSSSSSETQKFTSIPNGDILFIISNQYEVTKLVDGQQISDDIANFSLITAKVVKLSNNYVIRVFLGSSPSVIPKYVSFKDIDIGKSLTIVTKLNIIMHCDFKNNNARIVVLVDDARFDLTFNYEFSSEEINNGSLVYSHPSITAMNLIVAMDRIDYALTYLQIDKNAYPNYCNSNNCTQCYSKSPLIACLKCNINNAKFTGTCQSRSYTSPQNKKKRSGMKTRTHKSKK